MPIISPSNALRRPLTGPLVAAALAACHQRADPGAEAPTPAVQTPAVQAPAAQAPPGSARPRDLAGGHGIAALPGGGELLMDVGATVHVLPVGAGWPR